MVSMLIDIASRYNRSMLGVSIAYMYGGEICVRTIGIQSLKVSHTGEHIRDVLREILSKYDIRLAQIVLITSDNGKNMIKAIAMLDAYYQSSSNQPESNDEEDEFYIDTDIFDQEYYDQLLDGVISMLETSYMSDLISGVSCAAHCIHLVVSHAMTLNKMTLNI